MSGPAQALLGVIAAATLLVWLAVVGVYRDRRPTSDGRYRMPPRQ